VADGRDNKAIPDARGFGIGAIPETIGTSLSLITTTGKSSFAILAACGLSIGIEIPIRG